MEGEILAGGALPGEPLLGENRRAELARRIVLGFRKPLKTAALEASDPYLYGRDLEVAAEFALDPQICLLERQKLWEHCMGPGAVKGAKGSRVEEERQRALEIRSIENERCRRSVWHWLLYWVWIYEPRLAGTGEEPRAPFLPWPRQVEFLSWLMDRERTQTHGICVKSRDAGVSWLCMAFALHRWLYVPGYAITIGSRQETQVDVLDDLKALLPKIRWMIKLLPWWMQPTGFSLERHAPSMRIVNPETQAAITGATGEQMDRGGRATMAFLDEAAHVEHGEEVYSAIGNITNVLISVSTPFRPGDAFARRAARSDLTPRIDMDWRDDPRKDAEWAQQMRASMEPWLWEREFERNFKASVEGLVIEGRWVDAAQRLGRMGLEASGRTVVGLDVGGGGRGKSVFVARAGPVVWEPKVWGDANTPRVAAEALEAARGLGARALYYEDIGVGHAVATALMNEEHRGEGLEVVAVNPGAGPDKERRWPDGKTSAEKFQNVRAELWWTARDRLQKTWEHVAWVEGDLENGKEHLLDELLALPEDPVLAQQLGSVTWFATASGKIGMESKERMARRGVPSPDHADALVLSLADDGRVVVAVRKLFGPVLVEREAPLAALAG